jgi:hypothetical protein
MTLHWRHVIGEVGESNAGRAMSYGHSLQARASQHAPKKVWFSPRYVTALTVNFPVLKIIHGANSTLCINSPSKRKIAFATNSSAVCLTKMLDMYKTALFSDVRRKKRGFRHKDAIRSL